ncbi:MAG: HEAT repeat domain-containing protein [Phycisphaerales bacterium]
MRIPSAAFALAGLLASSALAQQEEAPRPPALELLERAWKAKDSAGMAAALDEAWKADPGSAKKRTLQVLASESEFFRPAAMGALARHADSKTLAGVIRSTDRRAVGERRWLTYALADRPKEEALEVLTGLLRDSDVLVRAAAVTALAHFGDAEALRAAAHLLREHPAWKPDSSGDDQHALQMALFGAFEHVTHKRPPTAKAAKEALAATAASKEPAPAADPEGKPERFTLRGKSFVELRRFNLTFDLGPDARVSEERVSVFEKQIIPVAEQMSEASKGVFGPILPASVRLVIADQQRFSAYAGNSFRPGVSQGNQVVLRDMNPEQTRAVLAHEYVHVLQQAAFPKQPRWLQEGIAESLSQSKKTTSWNLAAVRAARLEADLTNGVFGSVLNWDSAASSGDRETRLYRLSHLAIDSLRFGDYGDADLRLFLLMSRIGEGETPETALQSLYDADPTELDARLRRWVTR